MRTSVANTTWRVRRHDNIITNNSKRNKAQVTSTMHRFSILQMDRLRGRLNDKRKHRQKLTSQRSVASVKVGSNFYNIFLSKYFYSLMGMILIMLQDNFVHFTYIVVQFPFNWIYWRITSFDISRFKEVYIM